MGHFYAHHTCVTQKRDKQFGWSSNQLSLVGSLLRLEVPIHSHSMCLRVLGYSVSPLREEVEENRPRQKMKLENIRFKADRLGG